MKTKEQTKQPCAGCVESQKYFAECNRRREARRKFWQAALANLLKAALVLLIAGGITAVICAIVSTNEYFHELNQERQSVAAALKELLEMENTNFDFYAGRLYSVQTNLTELKIRTIFPEARVKLLESLARRVEALEHPPTVNSNDTLNFGTITNIPVIRLDGATFVTNYNFKAY